jgi:hypothetical protein
VQPDRLAPLFTLSEYTKQGAASSSKHDLPPDRNKLRTRGSGENPASQPGTLCVETDAGGRQRVYRTRSGMDKGSGKMWEGFDMVRDVSMLASADVPQYTSVLDEVAAPWQQQLILHPHHLTPCCDTAGTTPQL